jgi:hypothetical protein
MRKFHLILTLRIKKTYKFGWIGLRSTPTTCRAMSTAQRDGRGPHLRLGMLIREIDGPDTGSSAGIQDVVQGLFFGDRSEE